MSAPGERIRGALATALFAGTAALQLRLALAPDHIPGSALGEGWGRLFVTAQVGRWLFGAAPPGVADLAGWPEGLSFWPTDPLVQALAVPLSSLLGEAAGLTAVTLILATLAGLGPLVLARALGAGWAAATAAGLVVQLSPFLLRNLTDLVLEVEAVGPLALAGAALIDAARALQEGRPGRGPLLRVGLAVLAVAATSPYYAVYLALIAALAALFRPRAWRTSLTLGAAGALACALALAPLAWSEGGARGRLGPQYEGRGYNPSPGAMVHADGRPWAGPRVPERAGPGGADPRGAAKTGGEERAGPRSRGGRGQEASWSSAITRLHGGLVAMGALALGLLSRRGRPLALLGLVVFLVGPGPARLGAVTGLGSWAGPGLLQGLLRQLPLTSSLGNPTRVLAPFIVLAAVSGAAAIGARRWPAALLGGLALAEAWLHLPGLALPATRLSPPRVALGALTGPTIVFPSGDPPLWHPGVAPKEILYLAAVAGVPVAYDYGRGRRPADLRALVRLSELADAPIGESALFAARPLPADEELWSTLPFEHLLVLEDRLSEAQARRLRRWLEAHATLLAEQPGASAWTLPSRAL